MKRWDWSDTWQAVIIATILTALVLLCSFFFADKIPTGYYIERPQNGNNGSVNVCVSTYWRWRFDGTAYCTDDYNKAIDFIKQAQPLLNKHN